MLFRFCLLVVALCRVTQVNLPAQKSQNKPPDAELTANLISGSGATFRLTTQQFPKHWTLIAYGDMRFTDPTNEKVTNPKVRRWLVRQIADEHPNALLLSGDVPYDGSVANDYVVYHDETSAWRDAKLNVYPAMGNHELHGDEVRSPDHWWSAFPELKGRRWYSVEAGNAYILSLDSNLSLLPGSRQREWLDDQLAHVPKQSRFLFVSLHHPPVADSILNDHSHDVRPNELELVHLFDEFSAHHKAQVVVIAGHIHNYQRFSKNGVTYLVSGGGGARPYPIERTPADLFQDPAFPNFHYVKFIFDGHRLNATMIRVKNPESATPSWETKDTFELPAR